MNNHRIGQFFGIITRYYLISILGSVLLLSIYSILKNYLVEDLYYKFHISDLSEFFREEGKLNGLIILLVWTPLSEEIIFRLWLRPRKEYLFLSFLMTFFFLIRTEDHLQIICAAILLFCIVLRAKHFLLFCKNIEFNTQYFYVFSALLFGVAHFVNNNLPARYWYIILIGVTPQVFTGLVFGHARLKYGFWYAVTAHGLINLTSAIANLV